MKKYVVLALLTGTLVLTGWAGSSTEEEPTGPALAHNVYFTLHDSTPQTRAKLVEECYTHLSDLPGMTFFAAGEIVSAHQRDVNVRDWDVGLHIVFASNADHDRYQKAPDHDRFVEANKKTWKSVRVFDTYIK